MIDEPEAVTAGRAAITQPLIRYRFHAFHMQCPTPSCAVRHLTAQAVLAVGAAAG